MWGGMGSSLMEKPRERAASFGGRVETVENRPQCCACLSDAHGVLMIGRNQMSLNRRYVCSFHAAYIPIYTTT